MQLPLGLLLQIAAVIFFIAALTARERQARRIAIIVGTGCAVVGVALVDMLYLIP